MSQPSSNQSRDSYAGDLAIQAGIIDPRIVPTNGGRGYLYVRVAGDKGSTATIGVFRKLDFGKTTNWEPLSNVIPPIKPVCVYAVPGTVSIGDFVYIAGSGIVDQAIANNVAKKYSIGVVIDIPVPGIGHVQVIGETPNIFSGLSVGMPVFLSDITLGGWTQTPVTGSGKWLQILGIAATDKSIHLQLEDPIRRA